MSIFWSAAANLLVRSFPAHLAAYFPFRDRLRFPLWQVLLQVCLIQAVQSVIFGAEVFSGGSGQWTAFGIAPVYLAHYFFTVRDDRFKLLFLALLAVDYVMILRGISAFLEARFFFSPAMDFNSWTSVLLTLLAAVLSSPFVFHFFLHTKEKVFRTDAPAFWQKAWLLPAFMTVTVMFFTCDFTPEKAGSSGFLFARVLLLLCAAVAYFFMPDILDSVRRQAALKEQAAIQEHLLQLQQEQHGQLLKHMEEVKAARHDLRQNLSVIRAYLEQNDIEGLKTYLGVYEKSLSSGTYRTFTRNFALNAVCVYYAGEARKYAIDYNISLDMPEQLPLNEPEICAMLGNLLENAIDACREVKRSAPFIRGRGRCEKDCIVLTMDNSCEREPVWENGRLLSSKHDGFGSGTWIVRGMAERCGGVAEFSYKNGVFSSSVLLYG